MRKWRLYRKKLYAFLLSICLFMLTSHTTYVDNKVKAEDLLDTIELKEVIEASSSYIDARDVPQVYEQQVIKIYHQKQLEAIGTNAFVRSFDMEEELFGIGDIVQVDKQELKYTSQATYQFMNDIQITSTWRVPLNFTGTFVKQEDCDKKLYEDDRIYIHQKQLYAIGSNMPVLDQDRKIQTFGSGKVVYDGSVAGRVDGTGGATENKIYLGIISPNTQKRLIAHFYLPGDLIDASYQKAHAEVNWVFVADSDMQKEDVITGDNTKRKAYICYLGISICLFIYIRKHRT